MGEIVQGAACEPELGLVVQLEVVGVVVGGHAAFHESDVRWTGLTRADGAHARVQSPEQPRWHVISQWDEGEGVVAVVAQVGVELLEAVRGSVVGSVHPPGWR